MATSVSGPPSTDAFAFQQVPEGSASVGSGPGYAVGLGTNAVLPSSIPGDE